jgi:NADH-quinone oxidoreductase subunit E
MWYLFFQMYGWIFLAFVLGWVSHWFLCCRGKEEAPQKQEVTLKSAESVKAVETLTVVEAPQSSVDESWKPAGFSSRPDDADELKRIKGIGAVIEETLNQLGVYQFKQIAQWNADNISWVEKFLAFPGRIGREEWVSQAQTLDEGGTTEFAKRVDDGDVDYS